MMKQMANIPFLSMILRVLIMPLIYAYFIIDARKTEEINTLGIPNTYGYISTRQNNNVKQSNLNSENMESVIC
ncbi:MAG: hypothetical protein IKU64_05630 [Bacteroides sp.]|nr:hypothetical protein [Bacteroides sp.]